MFCEKCGKQLPDGSAFCDGCGAKVTQEAAPAAPAKPSFFATLLAKAKAIHQKNKLIFPIAGGVVVVAIALLIVFGILGKQVSVKDYMNITTEGYDGYGYVDFDFGYTSFGMRAVGDKDVKGYDEDLEEDDDFRYMEKSDVSKDYRDNFKDAQRLVDSIEWEITYPEDKSNGKLSNGDVIKVEIKCKESYAEDLGLTLQDLTFEYTVEGLDEIVELDVLSYFDLVGEGYDGYGKVQLKCNFSGTKHIGGLVFDMTEGESYISYHYEDEEWTSSIYPSINTDTYNKSNGDKIEVSLGYSEDTFVESAGVKLINLEKEYTVENLKESQEVDLLSYYDIEFTGLNGSGRGQITPKQETATFGNYTVNLQNGEWTKNGEYVGYTSVYLNDSYSLSNGDTVKAYVSYSEYTFGQAGVKFINAEQNFTISNLGTYATALSEILSYEDVVAEDMQFVSDYLNENWGAAVHNHWYGSYSKQSVGDDMKLYKMVLTTPKSSSSYNKNVLWMIYSVTISDNEITTPTTYYFAVRHEDVAVYVDGGLYAGDYSTRYSGYASYDTLYTELIDSYNLNIDVSE
ncbi:MAG: zinc-ribbon domain-containing protein [Ruminococcaceae bacterium]|nr:zinc-ribbon domain-containing protein [Oscillospiraceae bacterium]